MYICIHVYLYINIYFIYIADIAHGGQGKASHTSKRARAARNKQGLD